MIITADICPFPQCLSQPNAKQNSQEFDSHVPINVNPCLHTSQPSPLPTMLVATADETLRDEQGLAAF